MLKYNNYAFFAGHSEVDPRSEYLKRVAGVRTTSQRNRLVVTAVRALSASEAHWLADRVGDFARYGETGDLELMDQYFKLGSRFRYGDLLLLYTQDVLERSKAII